MDLFIPDYKENIIEGEIKGKDISIYDHTTNTLSIYIGARTKNFTVIVIDSVEKKMDDFPYRVLSIKKIDAMLSNLNNIG